jgi:hypothetical protein
MKQIPIFLLIMPMLLSGCGDSRIRELRGAFIESCEHSGPSKEVCKCIFAKYEKVYTNDQLLDTKIGKIPSDFMDVTMKSTAQCVRDN